MMICENMPMKEYRAADGLNVSSYRYVWDQDGEKIKDNMETEVKVNEAMDFGTIIHTAILEPDKLAGSYAVFTGKTRRGKAWDAFKAENEGIPIVSQQTEDAIPIICDNVAKNHEAMGILNQSAKEVSMFWEESCGCQCKARLDVVDFDGRLIADVKTTSKIGFRQFSRQVFDTGLMIQVGHYAQAFRKCTGADHNPTFWFLCCESVAPYRVVCRPLSEEAVEYGRVNNLATIAKIFIGQTGNGWTKLADEEGVREIDLPEYMKETPKLDFS